MPTTVLLAKLLGGAVARWILSMVPSWVEHRWYPDAKLAGEVEIRTTLEHEGPTLRLETWNGTPRLAVHFVLQNRSLYRVVRVDRLVVSIDGGFNVLYEGWADEGGPEVIQMTASLTLEQGAWLSTLFHKYDDIF